MNPPSRLLALAIRSFHARRARDTALDEFSWLFGEPAWDMLLDLYIAQHEGSCRTVMSVCAASGAKPTTALRYVGHLVNARLVERATSPTDRRSALLTLSARGQKLVEDALNRMKQSEEMRT